jgi:hypothetical protein
MTFMAGRDRMAMQMVVFVGMVLLVAGFAFDLRRANRPLALVPVPRRDRR